MEVAGVVVAQIVDEFRDMLYATQFISLSSTNYQTVWWKLFHSPNASDWTNALKLAHLLFHLPISNRKLERVFSTMKNIKLEKRSSMSSELLDDLLVINVEKVTVEDFSADDSIELWWKAKLAVQTSNKERSTERSSKKFKVHTAAMMRTLIQIQVTTMSWKIGIVGWMTIVTLSNVPIVVTFNVVMFHTSLFDIK